MGIRLRKLFAPRRTSSPENAGSTRSTVLVDGASLIDSSGDGRMIRPRDKVFILKRLAAFVEKEEISLTAVLPAPPLREAGDGEQYRGVTVRYAADSENLGVIAKVLKKIGSRAKPVVITANREIEDRMAALGVPTMSPSTFKKAVESDEPPRRRPQYTTMPEHATTPTAGTSELAEEDREEDAIINSLVDPL